MFLRSSVSCLIIYKYWKFPLTSFKLGHLFFCRLADVVICEWVWDDIHSTLPSSKMTWSCLYPLIHIYLSIIYLSILCLFLRRSYSFSFSFLGTTWFFTFFSVAFCSSQQYFDSSLISVHFLKTFSSFFSFWTVYYFFQSSRHFTSSLKWHQNNIKLVFGHGKYEFRNMSIPSKKGIDVWRRRNKDPISGTFVYSGAVGKIASAPAFFRSSWVTQLISKPAQVDSDQRSVQTAFWCALVFLTSLAFCLLSLKVWGDENALRCGLYLTKWSPSSQACTCL